MQAFRLIRFENCKILCGLKLNRFYNTVTFIISLKICILNSQIAGRQILQGLARHRYIINAFTRMRFCYLDHRFDFACKSPLKDAPAELTPWFNLDNPTL